MSDDIERTDIPDSGGLQIIERTVTTNPGKEIQRETIDFEALIRQRIKEEGCCNLEGLEIEIDNQKDFNKKVRVLFRILRSFPENQFALKKLKKTIFEASPPWRILFHAENIPDIFHRDILNIFGKYLEQNSSEIYQKLELCEAIGKSLSHIACFSRLRYFLYELVSLIPSEITSQILIHAYFGDELEEELLKTAERYSNSMTENQIRVFQRKKMLHERRKLSNLRRPSSIEIPQGGVIFQIFPDDLDGHRSFNHFKRMIGEHDFVHKEVGGIHVFQSKTLKFIVNDPSCGCDENIQYFLEQNEEDIDMCIIRGHTGLVNIYDVLSACDARIVMIGGCESSKTLRKDIQSIADREKIPGTIQGKFYIASNGIGKMGINDKIIDEIIRSAELGKSLETKAINGISGGTYDVFYIDE